MESKQANVNVSYIYAHILQANDAGVCFDQFSRIVRHVCTCRGVRFTGSVSETEIGQLCQFIYDD